MEEAQVMVQPKLPSIFVEKKGAVWYCKNCDRAWQLHWGGMWFCPTVQKPSRD